MFTWNGYIIDGHNRYNICKENNITNYPIKEMSFDSKDDVLAWILENQLGRRNLTDFQRNEVALRYEKIIAERMKAKQREGQEKGRMIRYSGLRPDEPEPDLEQLEEPHTSKRKELAKIAGTSQKWEVSLQSYNAKCATNLLFGSQSDLNILDGNLYTERKKRLIRALNTLELV